MCCYPATSASYNATLAWGRSLAPPDTVGELPIKYALSRIANRRNAAKARIAYKK